MPFTTLVLTLASTRPITESATQLRGFFAIRFSKYELLHQHANAGKLIYRYPKIQYKIIDGTPMVVGINEGAEVLKEIYDKFDEIRLDEGVYEVVEEEIFVQDVEFGLSDKIHAYEFVTPWLALNQKNYMKFYGLKNEDEQMEFLYKIFTGNLLSMSKLLDYYVPDRIKCDV